MLPDKNVLTPILNIPHDPTQWSLLEMFTDCSSNWFNSDTKTGDLNFDPVH